MARACSWKAEGLRAILGLPRRPSKPVLSPAPLKAPVSARGLGGWLQAGSGEDRRGA